MSIFNLVDYEASTAVEIQGPDDSGPIGLTIHVKSSQCKAAVKLQRKSTSKALAMQLKAGKKGRDESSIQTMIEGTLDNAPDVTAACVTGWDVSAELKKAHPDDDWEFTPENVGKYLGIHWLAPQVAEAADDISNFTAK